jgi:hypothetical protein
MNTKPRTFHIDNQTFKHLEAMAGLRKLSKSSFLRALINEEFVDDRILRLSVGPSRTKEGVSQ